MTRYTGVMVGAGVELATAQLDADPTGLATSVADVAGLTITFVAPTRAFVVEAYIPRISVATAGSFVTIAITDAANTSLATAIAAPVTAGYSLPPILLRARLPRTGTGAYAITPGDSYTFKVRALVNAGASTIHTDTGTSRPQIRAVTL